MKSIKPTGERRIVSLDEAIRRVEGYVPPEKQPDFKFIPPGFEVDNFLIEGGTAPDKLTFNESLEALKKRGYQRHLRPDEYFKMVADKFDENNCAETQEILYQIEHGSSTWLSFALEWDDIAIRCYTDLEFAGFDPKEKVYSVDWKNFNSYGSYKFVHSDTISSGKWMTLKELPREFVELIYPDARWLDEKPFNLQMGPCIMFPSNKKIWPMVISDLRFNGEFTYSIQPATHATSRGVIER